MKNIFFLFLIFLLHESLQAQMRSDALLFSETHPTITARSMGLGNALGALGGDLSTASLNPAGMAVYRRMEVALSMGAYFDNTSTDFVGYGYKDRTSKFSFGGFGLVLAAKMRNERNKWKSFNVGLTINRIANYARDFTFEGISTGSRIQSFAENANGYAIDELGSLEGYIAWQAYLIDSVAPYTYSPNGGVSDSTYTLKNQSVQRTGGVNELGLTIGANYNNKLYLAATIGVDFMTMKEDRNYTEIGDSMDFQTLSFTENRDIKGTGINLKIGMIYRINKMFRFGLAIHTPTAYRIVDSYNTGLSAQILYDSSLQTTNFPMENEYAEILQHNMATPWVFMGSLGIVIGKKGFIGLDVEYTDYSWASFSLLENDKTPGNTKFINDLNNDIGNLYQGVLKARIGGEIAIKMARIRLGYQFQTSPQTNAVEGVTDMRHDISAGFGIRWKHFFLDFAYVHTLSDFEYRPYNHSRLVQQVTGMSQTGHAMLTVGASIFRSPRM